MQTLMKIVLVGFITASLTGCNAPPSKVNSTHVPDAVARELNEFLDNWHLAAAQANSNVFFGSMSENSIYIGTDATERWTKPEFLKFAKPYFDKGKAWDFKPYDRDLHISGDGRHAWFSELLTTWMGVCRGSGILTKTKRGWTIQQYHLSVTVPNDVVKDFITLVNDFHKRTK
jgi:hypothetical protein